MSEMPERERAPEKKEIPCPLCKGLGELQGVKCPKCDGKGKIPIPTQPTL